jgi:adenosylcobinamide kinase/adenosylcobinamide-phosphate guanylyltransferase
MKILILGGSKSGKSDFAQEVALKLAEGGVHYYVATLQNTGTEADKATVASHLQRREGMDFVTVEQGRNILGCLEKTDLSGTFLLDSVTTLLTNEIFPPEKNMK